MTVTDPKEYGTKMVTNVGDCVIDYSVLNIAYNILQTSLDPQEKSLVKALFACYNAVMAE